MVYTFSFLSGLRVIFHDLLVYCYGFLVPMCGDYVIFRNTKLHLGRWSCFFFSTKYCNIEKNQIWALEQYISGVGLNPCRLSNSILDSYHCDWGSVCSVNYCILGLSKPILKCCFPVSFSRSSFSQLIIAYHYEISSLWPCLLISSCLFFCFQFFFLLR